MKKTMKKIEIDIDTYKRLLDERRDEFWVYIQDELWDFAIQNHLFDLIKHYRDTDPMVIVDNLAVNTEWCTAENFNDSDKYEYMGFKTFDAFCKAKAIAYNDKIAILHW